MYFRTDKIIFQNREFFYHIMCHGDIVEFSEQNSGHIDEILKDHVFWSSIMIPDDLMSHKKLQINNVIVVIDKIKLKEDIHARDYSGYKKDFKSMDYPFTSNPKYLLSKQFKTPDLIVDYSLYYD